MLLQPVNKKLSSQVHTKSKMKLKTQILSHQMIRNKYKNMYPGGDNNKLTYLWKQLAKILKEDKNLKSQHIYTMF